MEREINVEFSEDNGIVQFINVFSVNNGNGDYFIKLGTALPTDSTMEKIDQGEKLMVKPLFVCAITKSSMKAFIKLLQDEYVEDE